MNNIEKILTLLLFFAYSAQVLPDNLSDSEKLFNWVENNYPHYFNPIGENTFELNNYLVRYYKNTDTYVGTLGENVYIYGEIFNGLNHVGSISDFIDLTNSEIKIVDQIKVIGSLKFITQTEAAFEILKKSTPIAFAKIQKYIGIIEQGELSHMWADEKTPRYEVDDVASFYSIKWYAGTLAHEATHSELYHQYQAKHGLPVPAHIWRSDSIEKFCIEYQIDIMKKMNAPQVDINSLNDDLNTVGCETDEICN